MTAQLQSRGVCKFLVCAAIKGSERRIHGSDEAEHSELFAVVAVNEEDGQRSVGAPIWILFVRVMDLYLISQLRCLSKVQCVSS